MLPPSNDHFPSKIVLCLKKVCYKVFCVKTISDKVVRHSFAYVSMQPEILGPADPVGAKSLIFDLFLLLAHQL